MSFLNCTIRYKLICINVNINICVLKMKVMFAKNLKMCVCPN